MLIKITHSYHYKPVSGHKVRRVTLYLSYREYSYKNKI